MPQLRTRDSEAESRRRGSRRFDIAAVATQTGWANPADVTTAPGVSSHERAADAHAADDPSWPTECLGGLAARAAALVVDGAVSMVALALTLTMLPVSGETMYWVAFFLGMFFPITAPLLMFVFAANYAIGEWAWRGRTCGKALLGLQVRNSQDGAVPRLGQFVARETWRAAYTILVVPAVLDGVEALRDPTRRTWHDRRGGTVVVRSRDRTSTVVAAIGAAVATAFLGIAAYDIQTEPTDHAYRLGEADCAEYAGRRGVPATRTRAIEVATSRRATRVEFGELGASARERRSYFEGCRRAWGMDGAWRRVAPR